MTDFIQRANAVLYHPITVAIMVVICAFNLFVTLMEGEIFLAFLNVLNLAWWPYSAYKLWRGNRFG